MIAQLVRCKYTWCMTEHGSILIFNISFDHIMVEKYDIAPLPVIQWLPIIQWCKAAGVKVKAQSNFLSHFHEKRCVFFFYMPSNTVPKSKQLRNFPKK